MKTYHYLIEGLVQGVSFRFYTVREASRLGISGTVRNTEDGGVEVFAQGSEEDIHCFEEFLRRGPSYARVTHVHKGEFESDAAYSGFQIAF